MNRPVAPVSLCALVLALFSTLITGLVVAPAVAQMGGGGHHQGDGNGNGNHNGNGNGNHNGNGNWNDNGNMGRGMGGVMLASGGRPYRSDGTILLMDDAQAIAQRYVGSFSGSGLVLDEIEEWEFNFYVVVKESAPPQYKAFQLLIDKWTGVVVPEPGPNMMWNRKYRGRDGMGHHGQSGQGALPMPVTVGEANAAAMQFVRERFPSHPNAEVGTVDTFYGYYNLDVTDAETGVKLGMLSVNGTSGQVWFHTWHGAFIVGREIP